jgi:hypothetical protein
VRSIGEAGEHPAGEHLCPALAQDPATSTVTLDHPDAPHSTRALPLLLDEINHNPPILPGDTRPVTSSPPAPGIQQLTHSDFRSQYEAAGSR